MHFGRDATRDDPRLAVMRPKSAFGVALGKKFQDGETVPHDPPLGLECGYLPGRGMAQDLGLGTGLLQPDTLLGERNAALLQRKPGTQAPGREILVADHERVSGRHTRSLHHCHAQAPLPLMRPRIKFWTRIATDNDQPSVDARNNTPRIGGPASSL